MRESIQSLVSYKFKKRNYLSLNCIYQKKNWRKEIKFHDLVEPVLLPLVDAGIYTASISCLVFSFYNGNIIILLLYFKEKTSKLKKFKDISVMRCLCNAADDDEDDNVDFGGDIMLKMLLLIPFQIWP